MQLQSQTLTRRMTTSRRPAHLTAAGPGKLLSQKALHRVNSEDLLQGEQEVIIVHNDQEYRLRHTKQDKLILTK